MNIALMKSAQPVRDFRDYGLDVARPVRTRRVHVPLWQQIFIIFALLVLSGVHFGVNGPPSRDALDTDNAATICQVILLLGGVVLTVRHRRACLRDGWRIAPFLLILGFSAASALWSQDPVASLHRSTSLATLMLVANYAATVPGPLTVCRLHGIAMWMMIGGSIAAAAAMPTSGFDTGDYATALRGVFTQKNGLGDAMVAGMIALSYVVLRERRISWQTTLIAPAALGIIVAAHSTTALLLASLTMLLTVAALLWVRRSPLTFSLHILLGGVATLALLTYLADPTAMLAAFGKNPGLTGRTRIWAVVQQASGGWSLFGAGYSAFWLPDQAVIHAVWHRIGFATQSAHSGYLETLLELGALGLALYVAVAAATAWMATRATGAGARVPAAWTMILLLVALTYNYDEVSWPRPDIHLFQWMLAYMACRLGTRRPQRVARGPAAFRHASAEIRTMFPVEA